jgi:hypothetical protein
LTKGDLDILLIYHMNPSGQVVSEFVIEVINRTIDKRIMVSWKKNDRPIPAPPTPERFCQSLPPLWFWVRAVKEVPGAEDGVHIMLLRAAEDFINNAQPVPFQLRCILPFELFERKT